MFGVLVSTYLGNWIRIRGRDIDRLPNGRISAQLKYVTS